MADFLHFLQIFSCISAVHNMKWYTLRVDISSFFFLFFSLPEGLTHCDKPANLDNILLTTLSSVLVDKLKMELILPPANLW